MVKFLLETKKIFRIQFILKYNLLSLWLELSIYSIKYVFLTAIPTLTCYITLYYNTTCIFNVPTFYSCALNNDLKVGDLKIKSNQIKGNSEFKFMTPFPFDSKATELSTIVEAWKST